MTGIILLFIHTYIDLTVEGLGLGLGLGLKGTFELAEELETTGVTRKSVV
jgi:hypothetical protein